MDEQRRQSQPPPQSNIMPHDPSRPNGLSRRRSASTPDAVTTPDSTRRRSGFFGSRKRNSGNWATPPQSRDGPIRLNGESAGLGGPPGDATYRPEAMTQDSQQLQASGPLKKPRSSSRLSFQAKAGKRKLQKQQRPSTAGGMDPSAPKKQRSRSFGVCLSFLIRNLIANLTFSRSSIAHNRPNVHRSLRNDGVAYHRDPFHGHPFVWIHHSRLLEL